MHRIKPSWHEKGISSLQPDFARNRCELQSFEVITFNRGVKKTLWNVLQQIQPDGSVTALNFPHVTYKNLSLLLYSHFKPQLCPSVTKSQFAC